MAAPVGLIGMIRRRNFLQPKGATTMAAYQIADRNDSRSLANFLQKEGQFLLPMVELIEQAQLAIDEVITVTGRATIEAVLQLSAQE
jgi:hypothetical protein